MATQPLLFQSTGPIPTDCSRQTREKRPRQDGWRQGTQGHLAEEEQPEGWTWQQHYNTSKLQHDNTTHYITTTWQHYNTTTLQ